MALFGVVLVALAGAFIAAAQSIGDQRLRTAATRVATSHLETLRSLPFADLDAQAGSTTATALGRSFVLSTEVTRIDATTGAADPAGTVRQVTVKVSWTSGDATREVSYTTAMAPDDAGATSAAQAIGTITMFPSPAATDAGGRPLEDIEVTVPLEGFTTDTLVHLSWTNADGTAGAKTLTSSTGLNWRGTIARSEITGALGADGLGEVQFSVSAGSLVATYTLALQVAAASPPAITGAAVGPNPVTVARPAGGRTCDDRNQCQNTTDVTFTVTTSGLDASQDSVIVQFQLHDGSFLEVPLTPTTGGEWSLTVRQRTTKFRAGTARPFRFTAIRTADGATATTTVFRDVVSV